MSLISKSSLSLTLQAIKKLLSFKADKSEVKTIVNAIQTWTDKKIKNSTADWSQNDPNADNYVKNRTHWEEDGTIHKIDPKYLPEMISTPDWNQNDPKAKDYIKNRPFYEEAKYTTYIEGQTVTFTISTNGRYCFADIPNVNMPWDWVPYRVTFDGIEYEGVMYDNADYAWIAITLNDDTEMRVQANGRIEIYSASFIGEHTIKVEQKDATIKKIENKYLGFPAYPGEGENSIRFNDQFNRADGDYSHAEGGGVAIGHYSHAEGMSTTASGDRSHAEGMITTASGQESHAEGYHTTASGQESHAEGHYTTAFGNYSHAEGYYTTASGRSSHVSGEYNSDFKYGKIKTILSKNTGLGTMSQIYWAREYIYDPATGKYTLVDGQIYKNFSDVQRDSTIRYMMVNRVSDYTMFERTSGIYKALVDDVVGLYTGGTQYTSSHLDERKGKLVIIGNGTSVTNRSNAHTLDWNGIGWYQGGLQVGGKAQDDGAKNVLLEGEAIPVPETAEVGQTLVVKSVDENGKPTEWECAEITISDSGQNSDWNQNDETAADYIKNRTHWEAGSQTVIEWDGNTDGKEVFSSVFFKVSDETPTMDDLIGASVVFSDGRTDIMTADRFNNPVEGLFMGVGLIVVNVSQSMREEAEADGQTFPPNGTYLMNDNGTYTSSITYGSVTIHKLDPKFLPEGGVGWEEKGSQTVIRASADTVLDVVELNGSAYFCRVSDATPTWDDLIGAVQEISYGGETNSAVLTEEFLAFCREWSTETFMFLDNEIFTLYIACVDNVEVEGVIFPKKGVYATKPDLDKGMICTLTCGSTTIHPIDEKFIPDTIARISDIPEIPGSDVLIVAVESGEVIEEQDNGENVFWRRTALTADHTAEDALAAAKAGKMVYVYLEASGFYIPLRQEMGGILDFWEHDPGSTISIWADSDTNEWMMEYYDRYQANGLVFAKPYGEMSSVAVGDGLEIQRDEDGYPIALVANNQLPAVTTESNGAFLRVIDGAWTAVNLTDVSVEGA